MAYRQTLPIDSVLIDEFKILGLLGSGGFANTYLALDQTLGREVAIKEYFPSDLAVRGDTHKVEVRSTSHEAQFKWALRRFVREAKTLAKFRNPNVVRVHRVFNANDTAYMVLEFVRGSNMEAWLKQLERRPSQEEFDRLLPPLLEALDVVHSAGILHRDIKPPNIYIRASDQSPVLLDFGAARFASGDYAGTTAAIVSKGYSPHEAYATDSRLQGPWTDIYGLAATLYRALTGSAPPESTSRVLEDQCVPAAEILGLQENYRPEFLAAIDAALAVMPNGRPQSIDEWRRQILPGARPVGTASHEPDLDEVSTKLWRPISDISSDASSGSGKAGSEGRQSRGSTSRPISVRPGSQPSFQPSGGSGAHSLNRAEAGAKSWTDDTGVRTDVRGNIFSLNSLTQNHYYWIGIVFCSLGTVTLASQWYGSTPGDSTARVGQIQSVAPKRTRAERVAALSERERKLKDDQAALKKEEEQRVAAEKERQRKRDEAVRKKAEADRLAEEKRERDRLAREAAAQRERERERELELERKEAAAAAKKAEKERLAAAAREKKRKEAEAAKKRTLEESRLAAKRERERKEAIAARKKAEQERLALAEKQRKLKEAEAAAEADRLAKAEAARKAEAKAEADRKAEAAKKVELERAKSVDKEIQVAKLAADTPVFSQSDRKSYLIRVQSALKEGNCYKGEVTGNLEETSGALSWFEKQYTGAQRPIQLASATADEFDGWLHWFFSLKNYYCDEAAPATSTQKEKARPTVKKSRTKKKQKAKAKSKPKTKTKSKTYQAKKKKTYKTKKSYKSKSSKSFSTEGLLRGTR